MKIPIIRSVKYKIYHKIRLCNTIGSASDIWGTLGFDIMQCFPLHSIGWFNEMLRHSEYSPGQASPPLIIPEGNLPHESITK